MSSTSVVYNIIARDNASVQLGKVGQESERLRKKLEQLDRQRVDIKISADVSEAQRRVASLNTRFKKDGERAGRSFGDSFKARLTAALRSLPDVKVHADSSDAEVKIAAIRSELTELSGKTIGIDIDESLALAELDRLKAELDQIGAESPSVQVRADTAMASAELEKVQAEVARLNGETANVDVEVDTSRAMAEIGSVRAALIGLGVSAGAVAAIPIGASLIGGLGGIAAAAGAAGAGIGGMAAVAIPAFKNVKDAMKAQKAAQDAQALSALQGAQQSSANAAKRVSAANRVANAQASLQSAVRNAAQQQVQSQQRIADAQRNLVRVRQQAGYAQEAALRQVSQAEQQLENAQYSAAAAQRDLNRAREQAARNLQDMELSTLSAGVAQEQAQLNLKQAGERLQSMERSGTATTEQLKQARLDYMRANIAVRKTTLDANRAETDYAKAQAKGVAGSDLVVNARHRLDQANQQVRNSQQKLAQAQENVQRVRVQSAQKIADAQRQVTRAQQQAAAQAAQSQAAITRAQRAVAAAQAAQAQAAQKAAQGSTAATTAADKYAVALGKLTPAELALKGALDKAKDAFKSWYKSLEPTVLPQVTKAVGLLKPALNDLTPVVKGAAAGFGTFLDQVDSLLKSPALKGLMSQFGAMAKQSIPLLGQSAINLGMAFGQLLVAFRPLATEMLNGLVNLTKKFRDWTSTLANSQGFQKFIDYVNTNGPKLMHTLGDIGRAFGAIVKALAPLGPLYLDIIDKTARLVTAFVNAHPKIVALGVALFSVVKIARLLKFKTLIDGVTKFAGAIKGAEVAGFAGGLGRVLRAAVKLDPTMLGLGTKVKLAAGAFIAVGAAVATFAYSIGKAVNGPYRGLNLAVVQNTQNVIKNARSYQDAATKLDTQYQTAVKKNTENLKRFGSAHNDLAGAERNFSGSMVHTAQVMKTRFGTAVDHVAHTLGVNLTQAAAAAKRSGIDLTAGFKGNSKAVQDNRNKLDKLQQTMYLQQNPQNLVTTGLQVAADKTQTLTARVQGLQGALNLLIGKNVSAAQSELSFKQSLTSLTQSVKTNGTSLDINTAKGQANRATLLQEVQAAEQHAVALMRQGHTLGEATNALKADETAIYNNAAANGFNTGKVHDFLVKLGATPGQAAAALKGMQDFAGGTNAALQSIKDKHIDVEATGRWEAAIAAGGGIRTGPHGEMHGGGAPGLATGGPVLGPGTSTSDSIVRRLSHNEHVWTAAEVNAAGGHVAVSHLRSLALAKRIPGLATGGPVLNGRADHGNLTRPVVMDWLNAQITEWAKAIAATFMSTSGDTGVRSHSAALAQAYARSAMGRYGWGPGQWLPLVKLWNQESGWNPYAVNPSSGAYGIPQSLGHGHPYNLGDYITQVNWGMNYIAGRYHTPAAAWHHEQVFNWYKDGLSGAVFNKPTLIGVGEAGPERVDVKPLHGSSGGGDVPQIVVNVYPQPGQSEEEIGSIVERRLSFALRGKL